jgi:hypothetical protein
MAVQWKLGQINRAVERNIALTNQVLLEAPAGTLGGDQQPVGADYPLVPACDGGRHRHLRQLQ